jgi:hypothetical protein
MPEVAMVAGTLAEMLVVRTGAKTIQLEPKYDDNINM